MPAVAPASGPGPLSPGHLAAIADARIRSRKIRRAATVAMLSGWTMALFAALTLLGVLWGDYISLLLGVGMAVITVNELRGAAMLRRFDLAGPRLLGFNQIGLGVLLVLYAAYSLVSAMMHPVLAAVGGSTGDAELDAMVGRISSMATYGLYGGLAAVGVIAPGLTAVYYFTRARLVRRMKEQTPDWVIQALRAAG